MNRDNCQEIEEKLTDYYFNELSDASRHEVDEHLSACDSCKQFFDDYCTSLDSLTDSFSSELSAPTQLSDERRHAISAMAEKIDLDKGGSTGTAKSNEPIAFMPQMWMSLAACFLAVIAIGIYLHNQEKPTFTSAQNMADKSLEEKSAAEDEDPAEDEVFSEAKRSAPILSKSGKAASDIDEELAKERRAFEKSGAPEKSANTDSQPGGPAKSLKGSFDSPKSLAKAPADDIMTRSRKSTGLEGMKKKSEANEPNAIAPPAAKGSAATVTPPDNAFVLDTKQSWAQQLNKNLPRHQVVILHADEAVDSRDEAKRKSDVASKAKAEAKNDVAETDSALQVRQAKDSDADKLADTENADANIQSRNVKIAPGSYPENLESAARFNGYAVQVRSNNIILHENKTFKQLNIDANVASEVISLNSSLATLGNSMPQVTYDKDRKEMLVVGEKEELANFDKLINFEQSNEQVVFYRFNQKQNIMNNFSKDTLTETAEKELAQKEAAEEEAQVIADNQTGDAKSQTVIEYKTQQRVILDPIIGPMAIDNQTIADSLKEIQKMSQLTIEAELPNPDRRISLFTPKLRVSECLGLICEAANLEMIRTETGFKVGKTMPADLATGVFALPPSLKDKSPEEIMKQLGVNSPKLRLIKLSDKLIIQGDQKSLTAISSKLLLDSKK